MCQVYYCPTLSHRRQRRKGQRGCRVQQGTPGKRTVRRQKWGMMVGEFASQILLLQVIRKNGFDPLMLFFCRQDPARSGSDILTPAIKSRECGSFERVPCKPIAPMSRNSSSGGALATRLPETSLSLWCMPSCARSAVPHCVGKGTNRCSGRRHLCTEAWLRIAGHKHVPLENRRQFYGLAAKIMRDILVDHLRRRQSAKRGGGQTGIALEEVNPAVPPRPIDFLVLDEALRRLGAIKQTPRTSPTPGSHSPPA